MITTFPLLHLMGSGNLAADFMIVIYGEESVRAAADDSQSSNFESSIKSR